MKTRRVLVLLSLLSLALVVGLVQPQPRGVQAETTQEDLDEVEAWLSSWRDDALSATSISDYNDLEGAVLGTDPDDFYDYLVNNCGWEDLR